MEWKLILALSFCSFVVHCTCMNTYTLYISKYIRPGFEISYTFNLLDAANPVTLTSRLESSDQAFSEEVVSTVEVGATASIAIGTVPLGYEGSTSFTLTVTGVDAITNEAVVRNSTDDFEFASKALSVYIQTDKAIYQPGQIIQFRAVCLKPDLRPYTGNVTYQVMDPNDNIVLLENNAQLNHGVAGGEFSLNKDAFEGDWKIVYIVAEYKETLPVTVENYKLPKFEVVIDNPPFIHPGSPGFTITVSAKYTYGKPVDGNASLSVTSNYVSYTDHFYPIYGYRQPVISHSQPNFDGTWEVFISTEDIKSVLGWDGEYDSSIFITANVTEALTSTNFGSTSSLEAKQSNIKLEKLYSLPTIKPGLSYSAYIRVSEQDGSALSTADREKNNLIVDVKYTYPRGHRFPEDTTTPSPWRRPSRSEQLLYTIPPDGLIVVELDANSDEFESVEFKPYTNATSDRKWENQWTAKRARSPSNSYLQISTSTNNISPGNDAFVQVRTTEAISTFKILIISRGAILTNVTYNAADGQAGTEHDYSFPVTYSMMPNVHVLVSYVREDGEIVADFTEITVAVALENQVSIRSSAYNVDAGTDLNVTIETVANAYVGVRAIDKSVLLLKSGNDISQDRVTTDLNRYSVSDGDNYGSGGFWWWWYPRPSGAKDAADVFNKAGMLVLTDANLYNEREGNDYIVPEIAFDGGARPVNNEILFNKVNGGPVQSASPAVPSVTPRSYFPETWLWTGNFTRDDGSVTFNTRAPDTITSWIFSAFSVSDEYGLGIANTSQITVFRNFFVSLNLPLKITRGEIVVVQANIFNYFDHPLDIEVSLTESSQFELIIPGIDALAAGAVRQLQVPADGATSVYYPLRISALGDVPVTVIAVSEIAADAVTRRLFVRPEGIPECYSASLLISRESANESDSSQELQIKIPTGIVPGSEKVNLYVYGELLGSTMNNLGRLLRTPSGCGEQNMLSFAPDVFVTLYLHTADLLDATTRDKAFKHFQDGYSNELRYKHDDGSYSAFGNSDPSGSTWLTAFVTKCFLFARQLRPELVEKRIIDQALDYLVRQQNNNGSMREPGRVIHQDMQGAVNSEFTMTAYVLITLTETNYAQGNETIEAVIGNARSYLERNLPTVRSDAYALSLVTYALQVSGSSMADDALTALEALATQDGAMKYWRSPTAEASTYSEGWRPPYYQPPTNEIEMTAYALLTYSHRRDIGGSIPIIKWLTSKQNELGGYSSTQDTVIAIQAMSTISGLMSVQEHDLSITVSHSEDETFSQTYNIDRSNSMVFNTLQVPAVDGSLVVESSGVGVGVAQLSVCYNVPTDPFEEEPFLCETRVKRSTLDLANVDFCCSLKPNDQSTGMFLLELGLPNGFSVDVDAERRRNGDAQLVELLDGSVNVYYNELRPNQRLCADVELQRYADVAAVKPSVLRASEYYKQGKRVSRMLSLETAQDAGVCEVCGWKCVGCPGPILSEWTEWTSCNQFCRPQNSTRRQFCRKDQYRLDEVDIQRCGIEVAPMESRQCPEYHFPCPDAYDGLWYDFPVDNLKRLQRFSSHRSACRVKGRKTSPRRGIPGTILNETDQYVRCGSPHVDLEKMSGFSLSLLVKIAQLPASKPVTIFTLGLEGNKPNMSLEKVWWLNEMRFSIDVGNVFYRVRRIPLTGFQGEWKHVVVTWNRQRGAKVYVDGVQRGISSKFRSRRPITRPGGRLSRLQLEQLNLGRNTFGPDWRRGYLNGSLSSLMLWKKSLSGEEVENLTGFFDPVTKVPEDEEPVLSLAHLRLMAPFDERFCFQESIRLSDLYSAESTFNCDQILDAFPPRPDRLFRPEP